MVRDRRRFGDGGEERGVMMVLHGAAGKFNREIRGAMTHVHLFARGQITNLHKDVHAHAHDSLSTRSQLALGNLYTTPDTSLVPIPNLVTPTEDSRRLAWSLPKEGPSHCPASCAS
jgi:hypothetical protein